MKENPAGAGRRRPPGEGSIYRDGKSLVAALGFRGVDGRRQRRTLSVNTEGLSEEDARRAAEANLARLRQEREQERLTRAALLRYAELREEPVDEALERLCGCGEHAVPGLEAAVAWLAMEFGFAAGGCACCGGPRPLERRWCDRCGYLVRTLGGEGAVERRRPRATGERRRRRTPAD